MRASLREQFGQVLRQGLPLALGIGSQALFNLVDLVIVGRLGPSAVAGAHVATTINFLPMILGNGVSVAALARISQRLGAGEHAAARALAARAQWLMLGLGLLLGGVGAAIAAPCVDLQGVTGEARRVGVHYLVVSQLGCLTMFALMQTTANMRAVGESMMPLWLLVGSNLLNVGFDLLLIFGWDALAIPAFGAPGAAYGTVAARGVGAVCGYLWLARRQHGLRFSFAERLQRPPPGEFRQLLLLSLPQSVQMFVRAAVVIALTRIAADVAGEAAVTSLGVTTRLDTLVLFASVGFASVGTTLCGRALGAGRVAAARAAALAAGLCAGGFGLLVTFLLALFAAPILRLFVADAGPEVVAAGTGYLRIALLAQPLAAFALGATGGIHGSGNMLPPMLLDLIGYLLVLLPVAIVLASVGGGITLEQLFWLVAAANLLLAGGYLLYLWRGRWPRV